jgi:protein N-terminal methyltransferase
VQLYTSNYLGESENAFVCKASYRPWSGLCLETQAFPDSVYDFSEPNDEFGKGKCCILTPENPNYNHTVDFCLDSITSEIVGSDTNGQKYTSKENMWKAQDFSSWYKRAKDWYDENCSATIDGVLGGIGWISDIDLSKYSIVRRSKPLHTSNPNTMYSDGSREFMKEISLPKTGKPSVACEVGAGIGRVTKGLLLKMCDRCDLIESSERLLYASPEFIGNDAYKCRFFASELQDWVPTENKYTMIWIQWVLCYLTDDDIVKFLGRCRDSLVDGGLIILKENTCVDEAFVVDVDDASVTRSLPYWLDLIFKAGLRVSHQAWQRDFPDDIYPVPMLALRRG